MKYNKLIILFSLFALLALSGCKTRQHASSGLSHKGMTPCEILEKAGLAQPDFETMNISKMNMTVNYGQYSFTFKSSIRVAVDSLISISIQPALGIEMFRMELTPKSFTVYDKFNRRYSENDYEYIKLRWGVDINYKAIEALFSHRIFTPVSTDYKSFCNDFKISNLADTTFLVSSKPIQNMSQEFGISLADYRLTLTGLLHRGKEVASITYGDLVEFNNIKFPETVSLLITMMEPNITAKLNIGKITFNKPFNSSRINTSRYDKIGLNDLLRLK